MNNSCYVNCRQRGNCLSFRSNVEIEASEIIKNFFFRIPCKRIKELLVGKKKNLSVEIVWNWRREWSTHSNCRTTWNALHLTHSMVALCFSQSRFEIHRDRSVGYEPLTGLNKQLVNIWPISF